MLEYTGQLESVRIWLLLHIVHNVSVLVPGRYQAKFRDDRGYPVERDNVTVLKVLHHHCFRAKLLFIRQNDDKLSSTRERVACLPF